MEVPIKTIYCLYLILEYFLPNTGIKSESPIMLGKSSATELYSQVFILSWDKFSLGLRILSFKKSEHNVVV